MNPFVKTYVDQMLDLVDELTDTLSRYEAHLEQTRDAKDQLLKQYWSAGRRLNALQETLERMPELEFDNQRLQEKNREAEQRARHILECTRALSEAIRQ